MKYRTKLYLSFVVVWLVLMIIARTWFYFNVKQILLQEEKSKLTSLASTIAQSISGDELPDLEKGENSSSEEFKQLSEKLLRIRKANQKAYVDLGYIYVIRQSPHDPTEVEITIDASDATQPGKYSIVKEVWPEAQANGILAHIRESWATPEEYTDKKGAWLTGIAPILDKKGRYVATLAVNVTAESINQAMGHMLFLAVTTIATMFVIGLFLSTFLARAVTKSLDKITLAVEEIGRGNLKTQVQLKTNDEFGALARAINEMEKGLEENERLKLNFARYVSKQVMEKILSSDVTSTLKGERRKITVLFTDIRHFASYSEKLSPEDVVSLLNEFIDRMLNVIFENNGTLDKFTGDGIMVEFGAPLEDPDQEKHAVKTAIEMELALHELNRKWEKERNLHLEIGIGINTGFAVVGNIGSEKRMEYTAIGDTVNVASRLEHASKEHKTTILISETTASALKDQYKIRSLGRLTLHGRETPIEAFTIDIGEK